MDGSALLVVLLMALLPAALVGLAAYTTWETRRDAAAARVREHHLRTLGFTQGEGSTWSGQVDGVDVSVQIRTEKLPKGQVRRHLRVTARDPATGDSSVELHPQGWLAGKLLADVVIGDPEFDGSVLAYGDPAEVLARMAPRTRSVAAAAVRGGAEFARGTWSVERPPGAVVTAGALDALIRQVVDPARALADSDPSLDGLADRALRDPLPEVRDRAAQALARQQDLRDEWLAALERHPDPAVWAPALRAQGEAAREKWLERLQGEPTQRWYAAVALARSSPDEHADRIERVLIAALDTVPHPVDVIEALAAIGTRRALPHLEAVAARGRGHGVLATQSQLAIDCIRSRTEDKQGLLTLADDPGGALSEARPHPSGRVSLVREG